MERDEASPALDEAFARMAASGFEFANGFVNHGPMACEALAALGCDDDIAPWALRFASPGGTAVEPELSAGFEWRDALGDYRRLPEWIGHFERAITDHGWSAVVAEWVPLLLPGLAVVLFHGAIRTAHAVRAVDAADTSERRAELARALGYWAARYRPGQHAGRPEAVDDLRSAICEAAAEGARRYLTRPNILNLHGITGAMAMELLVDHISAEAAAAGLAQLRAEHVALYRGIAPATDYLPAGVDGDELARSAAGSGDPHEVKLVEACRRGLGATGDPVFAAAAETVTGHRSRTP
jgi:hypothetical protein